MISEVAVKGNFKALGPILIKNKVGSKMFYIFFITSLDNKVSDKPEEYYNFIRKQKLVSHFFSLDMNLLKITF